MAVFDVDSILFGLWLLPALTRRLVNEGVFPERVREELSRDYYPWVERRGSYDTYDRLVVDLFLREPEDVTVVDLQRCARAEVEAHGKRSHMYTHDMAARLKRAGYQLIAISGSPQEILDLLLTPLGSDRSWGTDLAQDAQGCYTGEVLRHPVQRWVAKPDGDLLAVWWRDGKGVGEGWEFGRPYAQSEGRVAPNSAPRGSLVGLGVVRARLVLADSARRPW